MVTLASKEWLSQFTLSFFFIIEKIMDGLLGNLEKHDFGSNLESLLMKERLEEPKYLN